MQPFPSDPKQVPNLWQAVGELQDFVTKVHASLTDPKNKQMLGEVLEKLKTARADAEAIVPQLVEEMKQGAEKTKAELEEMQLHYQKLQTDFEARMKAEKEKQDAAPPPPHAVPRKKFELTSGRDLCRELLENAGIMHKSGAAPQQDHKDIWEPGLTAYEEEQAKTEKAASSKKIPSASAAPSVPAAISKQPAPGWNSEDAVFDDEVVEKPSGKDKPVKKPVGPEPASMPPKTKPSQPDSEKEIWDTGISEIGE